MFEESRINQIEILEESSVLRDITNHDHNDFLSLKSTLKLDYNNPLYYEQYAIYRENEEKN